MKSNKKVAIITIFDNFNNGTYLQAFATAYVVEQLGHRVLFVDYCRSFNSYKNYFNVLMHTCRNLLKVILRLCKYINRRKKMQSIVSTNFKTSRSYVGYNELEKNPPNADIYLTGSDQVWNTIHNHGIDLSYFWGEINDTSKPIISYAASIGLGDFADADKPIIRKFLNRYSKISVREQQAVDILKNMGIESTLVLDPTLLLDKNGWLAAMNLQNQITESPYILVYSVETASQDDLIEASVRKIADYLKLPVWQMCFGKAVYKEYVSKYIEEPQPAEFINLIAGASFVVACSFHGTAFSINFNKPFVSIVPEKYSSRVKSLLNIFNLRNHFITNADSLNCEEIVNIGYTHVNTILKRKRDYSIKFLCDALSGK